MLGRSFSCAEHQVSALAGAGELAQQTVTAQMMTGSPLCGVTELNREVVCTLYIWDLMLSGVYSFLFT